MMINHTQFGSGDRPQSLRLGMVGHTATDLVRRSPTPSRAPVFKRAIPLPELSNGGLHV